MKIIKYSEGYSNVWDSFIAMAKNEHFLFYRKYMEYHSESFTDHSLLVFDDKERLLAILPANISGGTLYSHQGLTFGGFVIGIKMTTGTMLDIFSMLIDYLKSIQIEMLVYKPIPSIYTGMPSQEELYALFISDARLFRRDVSSTIDLSVPYKYSKGRKWTVNKAKKENIELCETTEYTGFWELLSKVLAYQHEAKPVHSLSEIEYLRNCFPENIKLYVARKNSEVIAGAVIYETSMVAHTQYLANSDEGREIGALDLLLDYLIRDKYKDKKYFDFGISTEEQGRSLNKGLIAQKEGFGASAIVQDFYELDLR